MPHLSPPTMTQAEQRALLRATRRNPRDHLIYSLALGTGLRLVEIVGLNVGDVYTPDRKPKNSGGAVIMKSAISPGPESCKGSGAGSRASFVKCSHSRD